MLKIDEEFWNEYFQWQVILVNKQNIKMIIIVIIIFTEDILCVRLF